MPKTAQDTTDLEISIEDTSAEDNLSGLEDAQQVEHEEQEEIGGGLDGDSLQEGSENGQESEDGQEESLLDLSFGDDAPEEEANLTEFSEVERLIKSGATEDAIRRLQVHEQGLTKLKEEATILRNLDETFGKIAKGDVEAALDLEDKLEQAYGVRFTINPPDVDDKPKVPKDTRVDTALTKVQELEERLKARDWASSDQGKRVYDAVKVRHGVELNLEDVWKAKPFLPKGRQASTVDILEAVAKVNPSSVVRGLLKAQEPKKVPESVKLPTNRKAPVSDLTKLLDDPRAFAKMFGSKG